MRTPTKMGIRRSRSSHSLLLNTLFLLFFLNPLLSHVQAFPLKFSSAISIPWSKTLFSRAASTHDESQCQKSTSSNGTGATPSPLENHDDVLTDDFVKKISLHERQSGSYWYESASHGYPAFGKQGYHVFRNVKDYGAVGDGQHDDTEAINKAITDGNRCGQACGSSSTTPAVIYFPTGTYLVSKPLIQYYHTQFVGNALARPTLKAAASFSGIAVIDSNVYIPGASGAEWYVPQSNFYRQIRNFVIDLTACGTTTSDGFAPTGIHWQVAQATSLQNLRFEMSQAPGTTHIGIFMENGSGGYLGDLYFLGGAIGMRCGSQQFTSRDLTFSLCTTAIEMIWDWGWTWKGLNIWQCWIGINVVAATSATAEHGQGVSAIAVLDSVMTNVPIGVLTAGTTNIVLENIKLNNVPIAVGHPGGPTVLAGGDILIGSWGTGNFFTATDSGQGETFLNGAFSPAPNSGAPASLRDSTGWFARNKPQYENVPWSDFIDVRAAGAKGDGVTDDAAALNSILASAASSGKIAYFPHGTYMVRSTVLFPKGSRIVGESWSQIMGAGEYFEDITDPAVMIRVGHKGDTGVMEISDMLFTVQGATAGAILMEWNIAQSSQGSAAMWDAHFRVGGAAGSHLDYGSCPSLSGRVNENCIAATALLHMTPSSSAYLENVWIWVADHDLDIPSQSQVDVYAARCFLLESANGPTWLWGTASEHCVLYQYQFYNTKNIFAATLQTETPYFQPNPKAPAPFSGALAPTVFPSDPTFSYCNINSNTCAYAWALEIIKSSAITVYGAGFYSWFQSYSQICLQNEFCQERLVRAIRSTGIFMANLYTKGVYSMIQASGKWDIQALKNMDGFLATIVGWTGNNLAGNLDSPSSIIPLPDWIWRVPHPTVYCHPPCTLLPPPTPIPPIDPPPFTTVINGKPTVVTPPPITSPGISVQPITIGQNQRTTVTPVIVPTPVVVVPPVAPDPNAVVGPGGAGVPPILPPPIPLPIPPGFLPQCVVFCSAAEWPPILPPIVVAPGDPIPVGAPPPEDEDEDDDDDDEEDFGFCWLDQAMTNGGGGGNNGWPTTSDQPPWAQPAPDQTGGKCEGWQGNIVSLQNTKSVQLAPNANSFSVDIFNFMDIGPANRISMDGATIQAYADGVNSWSTQNKEQGASTPAAGSSASGNFITFDVPTRPLPYEITLSGSVTPSTGGRALNIRFIIQASKSCGGNGIPPPSSSGGGISGDDGWLNDCERKNRIHQTYCQNIPIKPQGKACVNTPDAVCVKSGWEKGEGKGYRWCVLGTNGGCALVLSTKDEEHGGFKGSVCLNLNDAFQLIINRDSYCPANANPALPPGVAAGRYYPYADAPSMLCVTSVDNVAGCLV